MPDDSNISILLEKKEFYPGNAIRGTVLLSLDAPIKARALSISLCTYVKSRHDFWLARPITLKLSGSREYKNGERHEFEIKVPESILPSGDWGAFNFIYSCIRPMPEEIYLEAKLDIPRKPAIIAKQEISVSRSYASKKI